MPTPARAPVRAVAFDLDGTLLDSLGDIVVSCNHALVEAGFPAKTPAELFPLIGQGAVWLCARAAGLSEDDPRAHRIAAAYTRYYVAHPADDTRWMPAALETLDALEARGLPLAVCTNKPRPAALAALEALEAIGRFQVIVAGGDTTDRKPEPGPVLAVAARLGIPPASLVMVGDAPPDVLSGQRAGARTVAIAGGFAARSALVDARPDALLESLAGLIPTLDRWSTPDAG